MMSKICEHEFEREDSKNKGYSDMEYDLYAKLDMSIRKNLKLDRWEIFRVSDPSIVLYTSNSIEGIVKIANDLEGEKNTIVECSSVCPKLRRAG